LLSTPQSLAYTHTACMQTYRLSYNLHCYNDVKISSTPQINVTFLKTLKGLRLTKSSSYLNCNSFWVTTIRKHQLSSNFPRAKTPTLFIKTKHPQSSSRQKPSKTKPDNKYKITCSKVQLCVHRPTPSSPASHEHPQRN
jgi:hypothetical protein